MNDSDSEEELIAIRLSGLKAETLFFEAVAGAKPSDSAKRGDARVLHNGKLRYVEIKKCQSSTINQIRAIKYIPLIIWAPKADPVRPWIVVPPNQLVMAVLPKGRGQHTEIALESANLSPSSLSASLRCTVAQLEERVMAAFDEGDRHPHIRTHMESLLVELRALTQKYQGLLGESSQAPSA